MAGVYMHVPTYPSPLPDSSISRILSPSICPDRKKFSTIASLYRSGWKKNSKKKRKKYQGKFNKRYSIKHIDDVKKIKNSIKMN